MSSSRPPSTDHHDVPQHGQTEPPRDRQKRQPQIDSAWIISIVVLVVIAIVIIYYVFFD